MKFLLRFTVSIVLLVVLFQLTDWREAAVILSNIYPVPALIAVGFCVFGLVLSAVRWNVLVRAHDIHISNYAATRFYWIGTFFGNYLPSYIGGDVVRAVVMKRSDKLAQIGASIIVERMTGLVIILSLVISSLLLRANYYSVGVLLPLVWLGVSGLTLATLIVVLMGEQLSRLLSLWGRKDGSWFRRMVDKVRKLVDGINYYGNKKPAVAATLALAAIFYGVMTTFHYFALAAVGAHLPWLEVLLIAPLIPLVSLLPISVNAIGIAEGTFVFFYSQAGVPAETALAAALFVRLVMMLTSLLGGIFWLRDK